MDNLDTTRNTLFEHINSLKKRQEHVQKSSPSQPVCMVLALVSLTAALVIFSIFFSSSGRVSQSGLFNTVIENSPNVKVTNITQ